MTEPTTSNIALIVPATGDLVGTWGSAALNPDFAAIDGFFGGVQTIGISNANIILTAPTGSITPSGGPTQSQNAVLRLTGALTSNVQITLPLPGFMIIENLTTGNFVVTLAAASTGQIIAVEQGVDQHIYNDGTNVKFVNLGARGKMEFWAGVSAMPAWVTACTSAPYLLCDGSAFSIASFPYLGARLGSTFGGNGSTTSAVPDLRGRVPLAYDGTGTRITTAGSGLNGQLLGAALDQQTVALSLATLPTGITSSVSVASPNLGFLTAPVTGFGLTSFSANAGAQVWQAFSQGASLVPVSSITSTGSATSVNTSGAGHNNVQPSQVSGIWVIKT